MTESNKADSSVSLRKTTDDSGGRWITILVNGQQVKAKQGESLAAALWADGRRVLRQTDKAGAPRGMFCGMGVCFDCLVTINGQPKQRACLTLVQPGMQVEMGASWPE